MNNVVFIEHWPRTKRGRARLVECVRESFRANRPYVFPDNSPIGEAIFDADDWIAANIEQLTKDG